MAYSTYTQVASEFKDITFSATTSVTDTEVTAFIAESDAEIDGILGTRFEVPVTGGATSLLLLKTISIWLTTYRIEWIMKVKTGDARLSQYERSVKLRDQALAMLTKLATGKMVLPDTPLLSSSDGVRSYATDVGLEHNFQRDVDQW